MPPRERSTKEELLRAGEKLFAREGIHRTRVRELNELAGQRNASALHYHFGSRDGLLRSIIDRHSSIVDEERRRRLEELDARGEGQDVRALVGAVVTPLSSRLRSPAGRDYLRIVPQVLDAGDVAPPALERAFSRLDGQLGALAAEVRRARLSGMLLSATTLLADRAATVERRVQPDLAHDAFVTNLVDMATAMLLAPVTAPGDEG